MCTVRYDKAVKRTTWSGLPWLYYLDARIAQVALGEQLLM
jgi:hypothetical protein